MNTTMLNVEPPHVMFGFMFSYVRYHHTQILIEFIVTTFMLLAFICSALLVLSQKMLEI